MTVQSFYELEEPARLTLIAQFGRGAFLFSKNPKVQAFLENHAANTKMKNTSTVYVCANTEDRMLNTRQNLANKKIEQIKPKAPSLTRTKSTLKSKTLNLPALASKSCTVITLS